MVVSKKLKNTGFKSIGSAGYQVEIAGHLTRRILQIPYRPDQRVSLVSLKKALLLYHQYTRRLKEA